MSGTVTASSRKGDTRKDGIVPPGDEAAVVRAARTALLAARDPEGRPVVERLYTRAELDSLFGSGPGSNALYIAWRPGLRGDPGIVRYADGRLRYTRPLPAPRGDHGATLPYEGLAGFCAWGAPVRAGTLPILRQIDAAPTVADWLGIDPPRQSHGRSILSAVLR